MPVRNQSSFSGRWVMGADFPAASPSPDITAPAPGGCGGSRGCSEGSRAGLDSGPRGLSAGIPIGTRSREGNVLPVSQR